MVKYFIRMCGNSCCSAGASGRFMVLHHVAIICSSEECLKFYERFGFIETFRKQRSYDTVVLMEGQGLKLEIFIDPSHPQREKDPEVLGVRHLAFKVDALERVAVEFNCRPIMTDWVGKRYCMTEDPDGNPIELHE